MQAKIFFTHLQTVLFCLCLTSVVHDQLIHTPRAQGGPHSLCDDLTGIDIADKLGDTL